MRYVLAMSMLAALGISVLGLDSRALAKEKDIPLDQMPKAVLDVVKAKFPGAKLTEAAKETEDGKTTYEVGLEHKGQEYSVSLTAAGKITEIEREIEIQDLPKAVSDAIKNKYPKGEMEKAEEVTSDGNTTYEVVVEVSDDKDVEVTVDASGKILKEEAEDEDEEDK